MRLAAVLPLLVGCRQLLGFESVAGTGDAATQVDAGPCQALTTSCNGDTLLTCTQLGELPTATSCPLGCLGTEPHCGRFVPSGGGVTPDDLDPAELAGLADGNIFGTIDSTAGTINGLMVNDFRVANGVAIFRFKSLRISGPTQLRGTNAIAFVSDQDIVIDGVIDARGTCQDNVPGPGGFAGGAVSAPGTGSGGGGVGATDGNFAGGGGGGGHGGVGGGGGATGALAGGAGGGADADVTVATLVGGSGGGGGFENSTNTGGGGGGAIQLISNHGITIQAAGGINAGGCGAQRNNCPDCSSGGGGAGGTILLEALTISIEGALAVNGGGGAGSGSDGQSGLLSRTPAAGGSVGNGGPGGAGAAGGTLDGASAPSATQRPGGGGGGIGRIRINTRDGNPTIGSQAILSPAFTDAPTTATAGMIVVQ